MIEDFDELEKEMMQDPIVRRAALENTIRRNIGEVLDTVRDKQQLSIKDLSKRWNLPTGIVSRLLHKDLGGTYTLKQLVTACDDLGIDITITLSRDV